MKTLNSLDQLKDCQEATQIIELVRQTTLNPELRGITLDRILSDIALFRRAKTELLGHVPALQAAPDIMRHLETVERLMEKRGGSLEGTPAKPLDYDQLAREIDAEQRGLVGDLHHKEGLQQTNYMTYFDYQMAGVNAYCPENFSFSPPPKLGMLEGQMGLVVHKRDNPVLFTHIVNSIQIDHGPEQARFVNQYGAAGINDKYYSEYIELLQRTSRVFAEKPDQYRKRVASIVAKLNLYEQGQMGAALQALDAMLQIGERKGDKIVIASPLKRTFDVPCPAGSTVYMPGAGFNVVKAFPLLQKTKDVQFVLNDSNPFVAEVLSQMASLSGVNHVRAHEGSLEDVPLSQDAVAAMVISLLHKVPKPHMEALAMRAKDFMKPDGQIVMFHPEPRRNEHPKSRDAFGIFEAAGFKRSRTERVDFEKLSAFPDLQNRLQLSHEDLMRLQQQNAAADKDAEGIFATFQKS
jgi:hypothetical protein